MGYFGVGRERQRELERDVLIHNADLKRALNGPIGNGGDSVRNGRCTPSAPKRLQLNSGDVLILSRSRRARQRKHTDHHCPDRQESDECASNPASRPAVQPVPQFVHMYEL